MFLGGGNGGGAASIVSWRLAIVHNPAWSLCTGWPLILGSPCSPVLSPSCWAWLAPIKSPSAKVGALGFGPLNIYLGYAIWYKPKRYDRILNAISYGTLKLTDMAPWCIPLFCTDAENVMYYPSLFVTNSPIKALKEGHLQFYLFNVSAFNIEHVYIKLSQIFSSPTFSGNYWQ